MIDACITSYFRYYNQNNINYLNVAYNWEFIIGKELNGKSISDSNIGQLSYQHIHPYAHHHHLLWSFLEY